ncbi:hypothetical protein [Rhodoferax sp.]|uniref:hypothetical protein n=1 Tax=Rhodoferax sp. TaxID=50421 RepID=UPI00374D10EF
MDGSGGEFEFGWFVFYIISTVLVLGGLVGWGLLWTHRKNKRERRAERRARHSEFRDWRKGVTPPKKSE